MTVTVHKKQLTIVFGVLVLVLFFLFFIGEYKREITHPRDIYTKNKMLIKLINEIELKQIHKVFFIKRMECQVLRHLFN